MELTVTDKITRILMLLFVFGWCVFIAFYIYKLEKAKRQDIADRAVVLAYLEQYKPMTITTTLKTDENFMAVLIRKLSDDPTFAAKVAAELKKKQ
jgi:hypothetical protein